MSLTQKFLDDPVAFLADYIVVVRDDSEGAPKDEAVNFLLQPVNSKIAGNNYVFLVKESKMAQSDVLIPAYWLPWHKGQATKLTLGSKARFLFTSEMTNCRFSVLTGDMSKPTVTHADGSGGSPLRDGYEVTAGLPERGSADDKKMRRLSRSGHKNPTREAPADKSIGQHKYFGQSGITSSAFVFGHRKDDTWKFYAQIVKGVMAGDGINALKAATDKVVPLDQAYEIA